MEPRVPFRLKYDSLEEIEISAVTALNSSIARGIGTGLSRDVMETPSQIVAEWNARYGKAFDTEIAAGSLIALKGSLEKNEKVRQSAKVNPKRNFANTIDDETEQALVGNYSQNEDWYSFLLDKPEVRKDLVHLLVDDLYNGLSRER